LIVLTFVVELTQIAFAILSFGLAFNVAADTSNALLDIGKLFIVGT
jgi:hypothetical protein